MGQTFLTGRAPRVRVEVSVGTIIFSSMRVLELQYERIYNRRNVGRVELREPNEGLRRHV